MPNPPTSITSPGFWRSTWIIAALELRQRRRSRALWVLGIVWFTLIGIVTGVTWSVLSLTASTYDTEVDSYPLFSIIAYFVLLFGTLVAPAISAGSIASERIGGTLATTQVTLVGAWPILLGKALAAWVTGVAFLVVAAPFVILSVALSQASPLQMLTALGVLALQIGLFTAIGVGLSAMISSPLFSIVTSYLVVAALSVGTLITFALAVGSTTEYVKISYQVTSENYDMAASKCWDDAYDADTADDNGDEARQALTNKCINAIPEDCVTETTTTSIVHAERFWWILAMNPYVVVGDAVSVRTNTSYPSDLFGQVSYGVRTLQKPNDEQTSGWDSCGPKAYFGQDGIADESIQDQLKGTVPVWWIGLVLQLALAGGILFGGYHRLRTPAAKLPRGTRIA
ncbi:ABC transporter permease subunit [Leucobacter coleopterorum]|uniref:ABC transporter permease subunit n=1 Tax=Leucobacter coleopterorum TaxID=2714933 RepID=A0ABX6JYE2_9MICO|nr:ABC transporter permease subunit [Leucobacter coleopterorum]QIM18961.1 ABC transporter permease subunit [Leucobacter coleopterorum]